MMKTPAALLMALTCLSASAAPPSFKKILIVVFENEDAQNVLAQPGFASLAKQGASLTNFTAALHPSQGNYLALTSGSTHGITSDSNITLDVTHIGDLLEAKGRSWKTYLEGYPGGCYKGKTSGTYVRKHNAFMTYKNVQTDATRCNQHLVPASTFASDLNAGQLPDYSLYVPDMNNDGHDTGVSYSDNWLSQTFIPLLQKSGSTQDLLTVFTFDEGTMFGTNHIYTVFYGDSVLPGSTTNVAQSHPGLLKLIETQFGLGSLGLDDASAQPITGIWK